MIILNWITNENVKYMRLKCAITTSIFLILSFSVYSQSIHITGKVVNKKNEALDRVNITLRYVTGGRIIAYAQTSGVGHFELKKDLQEYVKKHTAPYKYPRIVEFRTSLPKTISGKIQRNLL